MVQMDLSLDYLLWDNVENVTLTSVREAGNVLDPGITAMRQPLTLREQATSGGVYQAGDVAFLIPTVLLNNLRPEEADTVTDSLGTVYTVLDSTGRKQDAAGYQTWQLVCRALAIVFNLKDTISIQRAALSYDAAGAPVRHWPDNNVPGVGQGGSVPYQSIAARVQPDERAAEDQHGVRGLGQKYTIPVDRQLILTREDRVKVESWQTGSPVLPLYLDILRLYDVGRIDELPKLECVRAL